MRVDMEFVVLPCHALPHGSVGRLERLVALRRSRRNEQSA
jgi:hypothetical protein